MELNFNIKYIGCFPNIKTIRKEAEKVVGNIATTSKFLWIYNGETWIKQQKLKINK